MSTSKLQSKHSLLVDAARISISISPDRTHVAIGSRKRQRLCFACYYWYRLQKRVNEIAFCLFHYGGVVVGCFPYFMYLRSSWLLTALIYTKIYHGDEQSPLPSGMVSHFKGKSTIPVRAGKLRDLTAQALDVKWHPSVGRLTVFLRTK